MNITHSEMKQRMILLVFKKEKEVFLSACTSCGFACVLRKCCLFELGFNFYNWFDYLLKRTH